MMPNARRKQTVQNSINVMVGLITVDAGCSIIGDAGCSITVDAECSITGDAGCSITGDAECSIAERERERECREFGGECEGNRPACGVFQTAGL